MRICFFFLVLFFCLDDIDGSISSGFYKFLKLKYGKQYADNVARMDYGPIGSFGGGNHVAGQKTKKTPTIFVAGWASTASFSWPAYLVWKMHGYTNAELYGTTYGLPAGLFSVTWGLRCQFVNSTRTLIKAVAEFTNSKVNVVAYSMGGPISRKAILGGKCVDTDEDLGPPLTNIIDVYLGVAGAMNGALACKIPNVGSCSLQSGMNCHSTFIKDINKQSRYEGAKVYVLQSITDQVVGYRLCGKHASEIDGANRTVTTFTLNGLIDIINSITNNAAEVLKIKPEICKLILPLYHWSSESLLDNGQQKEVPRETQHLDRLSAFPIQFDSRILWHLFWTVWDAVTRTAAAVGVIRDEAQWLFSCPNCELLINENVIFCLVDDEQILNTYKRLLINSYVSTNPRIKWCPATDCIFATEVPIAESCGVPCQCGNIFCFDCGSEWHEPASCDALKKWMKMMAEDRESMKWLHMHSKPCPKCKSPIEKNGGCDHLRCKSCKHEFCWLCMGNWIGHRQCNRYKQANNEQDQISADIQRYSHYNLRYTNHKAAIKIQEQMYVIVLEKMEAIQNVHQYVRSETQFLQRAFDTLVRSRRTLMYSYVLAFYLEKNNQSMIFEDNQGILEVTLEMLSELLERELDCDLRDLNQWKQNVQDQSFRLQQQRNNLIKHVNAGVENGELKSRS
ncbi:RBR-type E3 ubiquitin transferase [Aphelenchoides besseyi]|nr:RBR-type E3 ubiquitin transferase [Aphelenchoides besseyi]KAI6194770.1 RBR-type E3 ubiquitin transferase [Aphelenchoides besseyi]